MPDRVAVGLTTRFATPSIVGVGGGSSTSAVGDSPEIGGATATRYGSPAPTTGSRGNVYAPPESVLVVNVTSSGVPGVPSGPAHNRVTVAPAMPGSPPSRVPLVFESR